MPEMKRMNMSRRQRQDVCSHHGSRALDHAGERNKIIYESQGKQEMWIPCVDTEPVRYVNLVW
eukprot:2529136-Amphidinium_carterae.1